MAENRFQPPPRKKNFVDFARLARSADKLPNADQRPRLVYTVKKQDVYMDVYTGLPNDKNNGRIGVKLDVENFMMYIGLINKVAEGEPGVSYEMKIKDFVWKNRVRSEEPKLQATIVIGKTKEGKCYVALLSYDSERPKIRFFFEPFYLHELTQNGGSPDVALVSALVARAHAAALAQVVPLVLVTEFEEPPPKEGNRGGGGGYQGNRGGGGGGGYGGGGQKKSSDGFSDDDFSAAAPGGGGDDFGFGD